MNASVKGGVILAVAVALVNVIILAAGLHTSTPVSVVSILVFIGLNIGAVVWALRQTADEASYGKQLLNGLVLGIVGAVLIFIFSFVLLTMVFPGALEDIADLAMDQLEASGAPQEQIDQQAAVLGNPTALAVFQAGTGAFFTVLTSVIAAAIAGAFLRKS